MNGSEETKSEIRARIDELIGLVSMFSDLTDTGKVEKVIGARMIELIAKLESAAEDVSASIIKSHKKICEVKKMEEKAAYGNDPAIYYTLGVCGEAGEMANKIVKSLRNGMNRASVLEAVKSELPDVIIYAYVLAYVLDIDLTRLVNEKVDVVINRANDGYYGQEIK